MLAQTFTELCLDISSCVVVCGMCLLEMRLGHCLDGGHSTITRGSIQNGFQVLTVYALIKTKYFIVTTTTSVHRV